jgi:hypothetical protein
VVKCLPSMSEVLGSIPRTIKKKKKAKFLSSFLDFDNFQRDSYE